MSNQITHDVYGVIAHEGIATLDGRMLLDPHWEAPIPITTNAPYGGRVIGSLSGLWFNSGLIMAAGNLRDVEGGDFIWPCGVDVQVTPASVDDGEVTAITGGTIRAVHTFAEYRPAWPGCFLRATRR